MEVVHVGDRWGVCEGDLVCPRDLGLLGLDGDLVRHLGTLGDLLCVLGEGEAGTGETGAGAVGGMVTGTSGLYGSGRGSTGVVEEPGETFTGVLLPCDGVS